MFPHPIKFKDIMPLIDKSNSMGWTRPSAFESLLTDFPDCIKDVKRNLRIYSRFVNPYIKIIAQVENNRLYDYETRNFISMVLRYRLEKMPGYKRWRWLKRFNEYIKRRSLKRDDLPIDQAKQIPILSLYGFDKVIRKGRLTYVSCPLHTDRTPSMVIYQTNSFYCFSCHSGGDSIKFVMKLYNLNFVDAIKYIVANG